MPNRHHTFVRDEILPSWWANAIQAALSTLTANFVLEEVPGSTTQVRVPAGPGDALVAIAIDGRWRWVEANVVRAHPGGAAGAYDVYVTAAENSIVNVPAPNTDLTNYAFALAIVPGGTQPAAVAGVVDIWRQVGTVQWDGAAITSLTQLAGASGNARHAPGNFDIAGTLTIGGDTTLYRAAADVLRTDDRFSVLRQANGDIFYRGAIQGQAQHQFEVASSINGPIISLGAGGVAPDTNLYRPQADTLATDDALFVGGELYAARGLVAQVHVGSIAGAAGIAFGSTGDVDLYRSAPDVLKTDDTLSVALDARIRDGVAGQVVVGAQGPAGESGMALGTTGDTNLYRGGVDLLKTDDTFSAAALRIGGVALASTHLSDSATLARLASPALTGTPTAPTAAVDTNTTQLATTAFVVGQAAAATPTAPGVGAAGTSLRYARGDHVHPTDATRAPLAGPTFTGTVTIPTLSLTGNATLAAGSVLTWGGDTDLFRSAVDLLKTDDRFQAALGFYALAVTANAAYRAEQVAAQSVLHNFLLGTDANPAFRLKGDGGMEWGPGGASATDVTLYRNAPDVLKTDDRFAIGRQANGDTWLQFTIAGQAQQQFSLQSQSNGNGPILNFGAGAGATDVTLYRSAADNLKTDDTFRAVVDLFARDGATAQVAIGAVGPASEAGIALGSAQDTRVYRAAAGVAGVPSGQAFAQPSSATATFPAGPVDGQDWYFRVNSDVMWHFKYSATTLKWHFAGGPPLRVSDASTYTTTAAAGTTNAGPNVVAPLPCFYQVRAGCQTWHSDAGGYTESFQVGIATNSAELIAVMPVATPSADLFEQSIQTGTGNLTAAQTAYFNVSTTAPAQGRFASRWLELLPVRST